MYRLFDERGIVLEKSNVVKKELKLKVVDKPPMSKADYLASR